MNGSLHPERPTIAAATENRLTAESGLYLAQTPNAIGASTTALRCAVALLAVVALVLGHQVALADEAGVSVWLPGTFGSLAAVPVQPGFQCSTTYYHATAISKSREEFEEGGRIVTGLRAKAEFDPTLTELYFCDASFGRAIEHGRDDCPRLCE
jgi:hypothetical protein